MKKVKIVITDSKVMMETDGFVGDSCIKESSELMKKLDSVGIKMETEQVILKEEYYAGKETNKATNKQ